MIETVSKGQKVSIGNLKGKKRPTAPAGGEYYSTDTTNNQRREKGEEEWGKGRRIRHSD